MSFSLSDLDPPLLDAHERGDHAALVALYARAADFCEAAGDIDAACFFLTHAFVFGLQVGAPEASVFQMRLWRHGREDMPAAEMEPIP